MVIVIDVGTSLEITSTTLKQKQKKNKNADMKDNLNLTHFNMWITSTNACHNVEASLLMTPTTPHYIKEQ